MKYIYAKTLFVFFMLHFCHKAHTQCPGGYQPGALAYDTTVSTGSGNYSTQFKFPKFSPDSGVLTCIQVCITITGRVTMALENNVNSPAIYNINYVRNDTLTGPGLNPSLTNQVSVNYGPYNLAASDGVSFSGPDFVAIGPDTVLQAVTICRLLTDSTSMVPFYGTDSMTYTYSINAGASVTGSGDYLFSVSTQGSVHYQLHYCYCPSFILPLNVHQFSLDKIGTDKAELQWTGFDDPALNYHYEIEISRNGSNFSSIDTQSKNYSGNNYRFIYAADDDGDHLYFFRIKQVYSNGYTRFSEIRSVELKNSTVPKINIYPNPSSGVVGIKFDNINTGKFLLQILNTQGQTVFSKEIEVSGNSFRQITTLQRGMYWLRLIDVTSHLSCVNQLLIK